MPLGGWAYRANFFKVVKFAVFHNTDLKLCRYVKDSMGQVIGGLVILGHTGRHNNEEH